MLKIKEPERVFFFSHFYDPTSKKKKIGLFHFMNALRADTPSRDSEEGSYEVSITLLDGL